MLSGLKLTPYADNAQFYGLTGGKAHYETLFDTAFVIWRKKGLVTRPVEAKDWADTRFLQALAADYPGQKVEEPKLAAKAPSANDRAIINKQIQIHFTPGSDEIMPGSLLRARLARRDDDVVRQHVPARRGQHRRDRLADGEHDALRAARAGGEELHREELPEHRSRRASRPSAAARRTRSRRQRDRGRAAAQPPHRHQGRPGDAQ